MHIQFKPIKYEQRDVDVWKPYVESNIFKQLTQKGRIISIVIMVIFISRSDYLENIENYFLHNSQSFWLAIVIDVFLMIGILIIHELLHVVVVITKGNLSITNYKAMIYVSTDAELTFTRKLVFQILPFITLTVLMFLLSCFINGIISAIMVFTSVINLCVSSYDIACLYFLLKAPHNSIFYGGVYRIKSNAE